MALVVNQTVYGHWATSLPRLHFISGAFCSTKPRTVKPGWSRLDPLSGPSGVIDGHDISRDEKFESSTNGLFTCVTDVFEGHQCEMNSSQNDTCHWGRH